MGVLFLKPRDPESNSAVRGRPIARFPKGKCVQIAPGAISVRDLRPYRVTARRLRMAEGCQDSWWRHLGEGGVVDTNGLRATRAGRSESAGVL